MARWLLILLGVIFAGHYWLSMRPIPRPPGVIAPHEPEQQNLDRGPVFDLEGHRLRALARFRMEARVLGAERYRVDRASQISPVDLAVGWGPMSSTPVIDALEIDQYGRFYFWGAYELPIEPDQITLHSANMHMIPANEAVRDVLLRARPGHIVEVEGYLVEVTADDGFRWLSSLGRGDSGGGACEIVYAESIALR
ncbi:hypothetical protein MYXO_03126 [Myxococcaceae bacterium]|nr:hypothetical protein MYXO_03126 [Myxococcaceae bacterium]